MICGSFAESNGVQMEVQDVGGDVFIKVLKLWCGKTCLDEQRVVDLLELGTVADRFQMNEVASGAEESIIRRMSVDLCVDVLGWAGGGAWLERAAATARKVVVEQFEQVASTEAFARLSEETLGSILDEDELGVGTEEEVFEAVLGWMKSGDEKALRGLGMLSKIRFPLMPSSYLRGRVMSALGGLDAPWITAVVEEAMRIKAAIKNGKSADVLLLGTKATTRRTGRAVRWADYAGQADGGGRRLQGQTGSVTAVAVCEGQICSGSMDGTVRVWNRETLEQQRVMKDYESGLVCALAVWEGRVISGHLDNRLRVWSMHTGECEQVLQGHTKIVRTLAVRRSWLVSGSWDRSVRVWGMRAGAPWACERILMGHMGGIRSLATWRGKVISGSSDATMRVWDARTGAHDATLVGHCSAVCGLAVDGDQLFSASRDGTIRVWATGTWAAVRAVRAYAEGAREHPYRLVVSGGKLVMGSAGGGDQGEVRVRNLNLYCLYRY